MAAFIWSEPTPLSSEIDVRQQVASLISDRGHYVFLRKARTTLAPTWNKIRSEAQEDDPFNHGVGHLYDDYLIKTYQTPITDMSSGPAREALTEAGLMGPRSYTMYLTHPVLADFPSIIPTMNDQIIQVRLDEETQLPIVAFTIEKIYDIKATHEYRDKGGRIEYWAVLVQQQVIGK